MTKTKPLILKHFSNWTVDKINFADTYKTNWLESNYWTNKQVNDKEIQGTIDPLFKSLNDIFSLMGKSFDTSKITDEIQKAKYYSELLKEYIFEDVRLNEYPDKPSRKNCMFLTPFEVDIFEYAKKLNFDLASKTLFEISPLADTKIHFADLTLLNCNAKSHQDKISAARQYWQGTLNRDFNTEVLLTGQFKILKVIDKTN